MPMLKVDRNAGDYTGFTHWFRASWVTQLVAGVTLVSMGAVWHVGFVGDGRPTIWPYVFYGLAGLFFSSGILARQSLREERRQLARFRAHDRQFLDDLDAALGQGWQGVDWLVEAGFSSPAVRRRILAAAKLRRQAPDLDRAKPRALEGKPDPGRPLVFPSIRIFEERAHSLEEVDIDRFEQRVGVQLSPAYRRLMVRCNGGRPVPDRILLDGQELQIERFVSTGIGGPTDFETCLAWCRQSPSPAIASMLPLATVVQGGLFLEGRSTSSDCAVFYAADPGQRTSPRPAADHLYLFLAGLRWPPGEEPPPVAIRKPKRKR